MLMNCLVVSHMLCWRERCQFDVGPCLNLSVPFGSRPSWMFSLPFIFIISNSLIWNPLPHQQQFIEFIKRVGVANMHPEKTDWLQGMNARIIYSKININSQIVIVMLANIGKWASVQARRVKLLSSPGVVVLHLQSKPTPLLIKKKDKYSWKQIQSILRNCSPSNPINLLDIKIAIESDRES